MDNKKQPRQRLSNKRLLVGTQFPTKIDNLNNDYEFDGKTAHKDSLFDITKKIKIGGKAKKMIRKDAKINALYNKISQSMEHSQLKTEMKKKVTNISKRDKSNDKRYSRR